MESANDILAISGGLPLGGSTTFLLNLAKAYIDEGSSLPIISQSESDPTEREFADSGISIFRSWRPHRVFEDRTLDTYREVRKFHPKAALACLSAESFEVLRVLPAGVVRIGIIQSDDPLVYTMVRRYVPWLDVIVGVSEGICSRLRSDRSFATCTIEYVPYGIFFPPLQRDAPRVSNGTLRVIYLGRIVEEQKRISRIVQLARLIDTNNLDIVLSIAGAGPDESYVKSQVIDLSCVRWLGALSNDASLDIFAKNDVFVLLSDYEGLPLTLLEAMGMGAVPVVADLQSGIPELVNFDTGIRIPNGDPAATLAALRKLGDDSLLLHQMSLSARALARENFSAQRMKHRYERLVAKYRSGITPSWKTIVDVPRPLGLDGALYSHFGRRLRRLLRRGQGLFRQ